MKKNPLWKPHYAPPQMINGRPFMPGDTKMYQQRAKSKFKGLAENIHILNAEVVLMTVWGACSFTLIMF